MNAAEASDCFLPSGEVGHPGLMRPRPPRAAGEGDWRLDAGDASLVPSFPVMMDDGSLAGAYDVRMAGAGYVPTAFIIDRAGKIVWSGEGSVALDPAALERALRDVVR